MRDRGDVNWVSHSSFVDSDAFLRRGYNVCDQDNQQCTGGHNESGDREAGLDAGLKVFPVSRDSKCWPYDCDQSSDDKRGHDRSHDDAGVPGGDQVEGARFTTSPRGHHLPVLESTKELVFIQLAVLSKELGVPATRIASEVNQAVPSSGWELVLNLEARC